ncbi:MAG: hypothetical protein ABR558_02355 [Thioalkalivibrio sp.]
MVNTNQLGLGDKLIALLAPVLGGALLAGISIAIDVVGGQELAFLDPAYVLKTGLYAAAGALLSATLFAARYIILSAKAAETGYLQVPWSSGSASHETRMAKIDATSAVSQYFAVVDNKVDGALAQELAIRVMHTQIAEQTENLARQGRVHFVSTNPRNPALRHSQSLAVRALCSDGYDLIVASAHQGDQILATDFQNSAFWWLNPKIAFAFLEHNLDMIRKGATITRIFGRHHPVWEEDETGAKQALIELQAKIVGLDVYTIDYTDFEPQNGFDIEPIDQLSLIRNGAVQPSLEWRIDAQGNTDKVYFVLGQARLDTLRDNFLKLLASAKQGSTLRRIEADKCFDPSQPTDCVLLQQAFNDIAETCRASSRVAEAK